MICLDTIVVITAINRRTPAIARRLSQALTQVSLPVIALFELRYGYARSDRRAQMDALLAEFLAAGIPVLPFNADDADHAGDIRAWYDHLIAAQARARGAILVTAKRREFERVPGLMVTDWTE